MAVKELGRFLETLQILTSSQLVEVNAEKKDIVEDCASIWSIKITLIPIETNLKPLLILIWGGGFYPFRLLCC